MRFEVSVRGAARVVVLAAIVLVALGGHPAAGTEADRTTVTLRVAGMTCPGCERTVESVLSGVDGVVAVNAERSTQTAEVTFDPTAATPSELASAVNSQTYYQASVLGSGSDLERTAPRPAGAPTGLVAGGGGALGALLLVGAVVMRRRSSTAPDVSPVDSAGRAP